LRSNTRTSAVDARAGDAGLPPRHVLLRLWAPLWIAYGLWTWSAGVRLGVDTQLYSLWADRLIAHNFNLSSYLSAQDFYIPPFLYTGWIVMVAGLKTVMGASWTHAVVFLNWVAFGAGSYAILDAVRRTTASTAGVLLAAFLLCAAGDLLIFMPFALSDLIFWGMASVALALGCQLARSERVDEDAVRLATAGTVLVLFALVFRPTGLTLVVFWAAALASAFARALVDRFSTAMIAAVAALAAGGTAWYAAIMIDPAAWPFEPLRGFFAVLSDEYRRGLLVKAAPVSDLMVEPAVTWLGAIRLTSEKSLYFLTPWLPSYSTAHALINLAFFVPAYGLTIAAAANRNRLSLDQQRAVLVLLLFVFSSVVFHSLTQLEPDHRYRIPVLSALIMLASIGLESLRRPPRLG
jgi:hypothetical protein